MNDDDRHQLSEMLLIWEESCDAGSELCAKTLCHLHPHLQQPLEERIQRLRSMRSLLATEDDLECDTVGFSGSFGSEPFQNHVATESRYQVMLLHASGGKGHVHIARDLSLGRDVAIKSVRPEYAAASTSSRRLYREAEITGRLKHPGIVPVYSIGKDERGRPFYSMQLVTGETFMEAISNFHAYSAENEGQLRVRFRQLLRHFINVCETVAYAHSQNVIHRDIKPQNILIGDYGETFLVDWGLAKYDNLEDDANSVNELPESELGDNVTREGNALGTPGYMSPEQMQGKLARKSSDIFSLGATLFTLLTGQRIPQMTPVDRPQITLADFIVTRNSTPEISPALAAICIRAANYDANGRYQTALELAADLESWLADEPVGAYKDSAIERVGRWCRRHKTTVAATILILLVASLALAISNFLVNQEKNKTRAVGEQADRNFQLAQQAVDDYLVEISENSLLGKPGLQPLREALLTKSLKYYETFLSHQDDNQALLEDVANATERVAQIVREIGNRDESLRHLQKAKTIREQLFSRNSNSAVAQLALAKTNLQLARLLLDLGRWDDAQQPLTAAIAFGRKAHKTHVDVDAVELHLARAFAQQAAFYFYHGKYDQSIETNQRALEICDALLERGSELMIENLPAKLHQNIGNSFRLIGNFDPALEAYRNAATYFQLAIDSNHDVNEYRANLAQVLQAMAAIERKRDNHRAAFDALDASKRELETIVLGDPDVHRYQSDLAATYTELGRLLLDSNLDAAEELLNKADAIRRRLAKGNPQDVEFRCNAACSQCSLGKLEMARENYDAAGEFYRNAIHIFQQVAQQIPGDPQVRREGLACTYRALGMAMQKAGRYEDARNASQNSLDIYRQYHQMQSSIVLEIAVTGVSIELAEALCKLGFSEQALALLKLRNQELSKSPHFQTGVKPERQKLQSESNKLKDLIKDLSASNGIH